MSAQTVLKEDWSEYDNRKLRNGIDHRNFACTEPWEVDDLVDKITRTHPGTSDLIIRAAIATCGRTLGSPTPRTKFVECVMSKL